MALAGGYGNGTSCGRHSHELEDFQGWNVQD
jgi:hypothetical protein